MSGVGLRDNFQDFAPIDPRRRYDDKELDPSLMEDIWLLKASFGRLSLAVPPVQLQEAWGFPFHAACWDLLAFAHPALESHLQVLFDILRSIPQKNGYLAWGHDYGGLLYAIVDPTRILPGDEPEHVVLNSSHHSQAKVSTCDPSLIPELQEQLHQSSKSGPETVTYREHIQQPVAPSVCSADPFGMLPTELLQMVLLYLPSRDVLSLKLSSLFFAMTPLHELFWASLFSPDHEYEYIYEARTGVHGLSWKRFYLGIRRLKNCPGLVNRRRIWKLVLQLRDLILALADRPCSGVAVRSFFEPEALLDASTWITASRALKSPADHFSRGCRSLKCRKLDLPCETLCVFVSFVNLADTRYISGLRFQDRSGRSTCLGYIQAQEEVVPNNGNGEQICGFHLAMDLKGLRALAVLTDSAHMSEWVGIHEGVPQRRLVTSSNIKSIKADFDVINLPFHMIQK